MNSCIVRKIANMVKGQREKGQGAARHLPFAFNHSPEMCRPEIS